MELAVVVGIIFVFIVVAGAFAFWPEKPSCPFCGARKVRTEEECGPEFVNRYCDACMKEWREEE